MLIMAQIAQTNEELYRHITPSLRNLHNPASLASLAETISTQGRFQQLKINLQQGHRNEKKNPLPTNRRDKFNPRRRDTKCTKSDKLAGWFHGENECWTAHPELREAFLARKDKTKQPAPVPNNTTNDDITFDGWTNLNA